MNIHFDDHGHDKMARIVYDFMKVKDCLVMVFEKGFNIDILFYLDEEEWISTSPMQQLNPATYLNIQHALKNCFELKA